MFVVTKATGLAIAACRLTRLRLRPSQLLIWKFFYLLLIGLQFSTAFSAQQRERGVGLAPAESRGRRVALVIGNSDYSRQALRNPVNDANDFGALLRDTLGFDTKIVRNADQRTFDSAVQEFVGKLLPGDVALFYFSGHGLAVEGENYLLPVNFAAMSQAEVKYQAYPANKVMDLMKERGVRLSILILDACRNNPYRSWRGGGGGLASMSGGEGAFIAFAADVGQTADDNPAERNGLFTKYLLDVLREPGLNIGDVFDRVRERVYQASGGRQVPHSDSGIIGAFYFHGPAPAGSTIPTPATSAAPSAADASAKRVDVAAGRYASSAPVKPEPEVTVPTVVPEHPLQGHTGSVYSVAFSPDGHWVASGGADDTTILWALPSRSKVRTFGDHTNWVKSVAFSPDGRWLASGSYDGTINIWDASTGQKQRTFRTVGGFVLSIAFSPDAKWLASASSNKTVALWNLADGEPRSFNGHTDSVDTVAFSPDGKWLASGSCDDSVKIWDIRTGQLLQSLEGHTGCVTAVVFNPDSGELASGSQDGTIKLWERGAESAQRTLPANSGITSLAFLGLRGRWLVSGGSDSTVWLWDTVTGQRIRKLSNQNMKVEAVAASPDGSWLAWGSDDQSVQLRQLKH